MICANYRNFSKKWFYFMLIIDCILDIFLIITVYNKGEIQYDIFNFILFNEIYILYMET